MKKTQQGVNGQVKMNHMVKLPITKTPLLTLFVFIIGFGAGYLYYEDQLPAVFSSGTETPKLNVCFSPE